MGGFCVGGWGLYGVKWYVTFSWLTSVVLVQRELDKFHLRLREFLPLARVFFGHGGIWITIVEMGVGRRV